MNTLPQKEFFFAAEARLLSREKVSSLKTNWFFLRKEQGAFFWHTVFFSWKRLSVALKMHSFHLEKSGVAETSAGRERICVVRKGDIL